MTYCSYRTRPSAFTGDTGAMCPEVATHYVLVAGSWVERCDRHTQERDVERVVRKRGVQT